MERLLEELKALIKAQYPFIYLVSYEEDRVIRTLRWLMGPHPERLATWTSASGFQIERQFIDGSADPLRALEVIRQHEPRQLFLMQDFHPYLEDPRIRRMLRDLEPVLEEDHKTLLFLSSSVAIPRELEKDVVVLDVPLPEPPEVSALLGSLVRTHKIKLAPELYERLVKASVGLTEKELKRVYARLLLAQGFDEKALDTLVAEKQKALRRSQFLELVQTGDGLDGIGGLEQLKAWVQERGQAFSERARQFGLPVPKGLFLLGVQGCGKSLAARAVARSWQLPLLRLELASMLSKGGTDGLLRDTIRIAEAMSPTLLWIDEIEKAFGGLSGDTEGAAIRVLGELLTWLQEKQKPVFVVATANDVRHLPPELLRKGRFDEIFFIDLPSSRERLDILTIHLKRRKRAPESFDRMAVSEATERFSGAELEQLVIGALYYAFSRNRDITTEDLLRQSRETVPLAMTMDTQIKALKEWARDRTRPAAYDTRRLDFFEEWEELDA